MDKIHDFLIDIGVPASHNGFDYIHDAIKLMSEDHSYKRNICCLYADIGKSYNTSGTCVERCIRTSIKYCFEHTSGEKLAFVFGENNVAKGKIKNSEFLARSVLYLK